MSSAAAPTAAATADSGATWRQRYPALARFVRSHVSVASFVLICLIMFGAAFGPVIWRSDPTKQNIELYGEPQPASRDYPAGTDYHGRDLLARLIVGARISLAVGIVSMLINLIIGVGLGTLAGWIGGWVDTALMRFVDALYSIPLLLIVIVLQVFAKPILVAAIPSDADVPLLLSPELLSIYAALGLSNWLTMARLARSEVINQKSLDYVSASKSLGAGNLRILFRHVLPNTVGPILVAATLAIPEAIFIESFLAFIGLGVSAPQASWGSLAEEGVRFMGNAPHLLIWPAAAISITMLAFNLFGDGLRDALDPSGRR